MSWPSRHPTRLSRRSWTLPLRGDVKFADVDWYALPNMGRTRMKAQYYDPFDIDPQRTTWSW
ncbi:hypothetical protein ACFQ1S_03355, partial [Kibdelosporangium lantanae]